jgi:two-component system sensor histidine kinase TctE
MAAERVLLRKQLVRWLLVPLFLLLAVDAAVGYAVAWSFSRKAYDRSLLDIARELSLHLREVDGAPRLDLAEEARQILLTDPVDRIYFEVAGADGRHVDGHEVPGAPAFGRDRAERFYDTRLDGMDVRAIELVVRHDARSARPAAFIRVAETQNARASLAGDILLSVLLPQAILIALAGTLVWMGVVRGLAPLEKVRRAVTARAPNDASPMAIDEVPAEVRPLLESINDLVARLDAALTLQSRFIADAAHQLKTPIAVLEGQLELAMRERDAATAQRAMREAHAGLERLSRVVSQLLSLARNEPEAAARASLAPLDLNALALEAASDWVPQALKKGLDLGFEAAPSAAMIRGDAARLRELMDNLIDNAVRYTPAKGRITVRVTTSPAAALEVSDDGPRIPEDERQRVFERFHRLLGSAGDGSGLGLAIAQEIARIHGATIELADDHDGIGNRFRVGFPLP